METTPMACAFAHIDCTRYTDELDNDSATHTAKTLNRKPNMLKQKNKRLQTAKFYTKLNETLHENFAYIDEDNSQLRYIDADCGKNIILVLFDNVSDSDLQNIFTRLQNRIHTVIYYQGLQIHKFLPTNRTCIIKTNSIQHAVTEAYRIAHEGQTIVLPKTEVDFDLFAHIYFS